MSTTKRKMAADGRKEKNRTIPEPAVPKLKKNAGSGRDTTVRRTKEPLRTGRPVKSGE